MDFYDDERFYEEERWDESFYDELGGEPQKRPRRSSGSENEGCYVATCVSGSYDCPQVWTLRRFRNDVLKENKLGRCSVRAYYAVSPGLVDRFGHIKRLRNTIRRLLSHIVRCLDQKGFENTPYSDRE